MAFKSIKAPHLGKARELLIQYHSEQPWSNSNACIVLVDVTTFTQDPVVGVTLRNMIADVGIWVEVSTPGYQLTPGYRLTPG